jgi:hypothetical protein
MANHLFVRVALLCVPLTLVATPARAQIAESVGSRALGMGGAFVAVASDSSATWWNPAGLAAGPFLDLAIGRAVTDGGDSAASRRDGATWFALATPPFGIAYYRLRIRDIQPFEATTGQAGANRQDRGAGVPVRSLAANQLGVTILRTLIPGVHAGTTLKYLRGTLEGGHAEGRFDLDVGVLAVAGPVRLGGVVRNVREAEFGAAGPAAPGIRLPRNVRVGAAFNSEDATGVPLTVALDADVRSYSAGIGERRVVAIGAEQWVAAKRVGIRAGGRFNTVGARERSATAGLSVSPRPGMFVDGHVVRGGSADDRGWGVAARVSF